MRRLKSATASFVFRTGRIFAWHATLMVAISCVALVLATDTQAETLTFDDLPPFQNDGSPIPDGYGGLDWDNMHYIAPVQLFGAGNSGYYYGMLSSPNVAYNGGQNPATVTGNQFTFDSAYFTGAWNDGLSIQIPGLYCRSFGR